MRAAVRHHYGSPDVLQVQDIAKPIAKPNEILIRVHATTVNRTDCGVLSGKPLVFRLFTGLPKPKYAVTGTDFAGEIEAVGAEVTAFRVGERVWGFDDNGLPTHAEYLALAANKSILPIPDDMTYADIVACAEGAFYALNYCKAIQKRGANRVLVYGASGAIGSAAVQILKAQGVYVTAVCNTLNVDRVRALGPDRVVDYQKQDFTNDADRYDVVLDAVGKSRFRICKKLLKDTGGIYLSSELGPNAENIWLTLFSGFTGKKKVQFPIPADVKGALVYINDLVKTGKFKPLIDRSYPLGQIREAFVYVDSGQKSGNVILLMDEEGQ